MNLSVKNPPPPQTTPVAANLTLSAAAEGSFISRHLGPSADDIKVMLKTIGMPSLNALMEAVIPAGILAPVQAGYKTLRAEPAQSETEALAELSKKFTTTAAWQSYIGLGYYGTVVPAVILRNFFENPGWYTAYTPYQAEVAQGRLEALINFQTLVSELMDMELANASLLDEATAAAEAMTLMRRQRRRTAADTLFASDELFPQTLAVLATRAQPLGIKLRIGSYETFAAEVLSVKDGAASDAFFGAILPQQGADGTLMELQAPIAACQERGLRVAVTSDLLAAVLVQPAGTVGADIVCGSAQRFGVPMGYGGPHAAFFAVKDELKRQLPGRVIGVSKTSAGTMAYRMALQTREQHIRRDKATSNICTAQALLANMAVFYAIYHGTAGLQNIARRVHAQTCALATEVQPLTAAAGALLVNDSFFDTLTIALSAEQQAKVQAAAAARKINLRYGVTAKLGKRVQNVAGELGHFVAFSLDETVGPAERRTLSEIFHEAFGGGGTAMPPPPNAAIISGIPLPLRRKGAPLKHAIFSKIHSETQMLRYLAALERKDIALNTSMIPLGSCTMKLNAACQMLPLSWKALSDIHPMVPTEQVPGYRELIEYMERVLAEVTEFAAVSLQPNSGAQGEYAGLLAIRNYHLSRGDTKRKHVLIPTSAHGTNPASAVMAGMEPVFVKCSASGDIDRDDFMAKTEDYRETLAAMMITYPSTHGVFEENIVWMTARLHDCGGLVYMDGANMNAQLGFTSPARVGADVCHLNLHKTFAIPHGGGGPGLGPIAVGERLAPFLPASPFAAMADAEAVQQGLPAGTGAVAAAPYSSASILVISYLYIKLLGLDGLRLATAVAILNANYLKKRLQEAYPVLYTGKNGFVAHEMILDLRPLTKRTGISVEDVAKRLADYGFHAPTMSWPVPGTLMIEPTESEDLGELERFAEALLKIREEFTKVERGEWPREQNPLRQAPHTADQLCIEPWPFPYTRAEAVYPLPYLRERKYWPPVARIDNVYGDRNLFCACPPLSAYAVTPAKTE